MERLLKSKVQQVRKDVKYLVFGGGGMRSLSYIGALEALVNHDSTIDEEYGKGILGLAGTSMGSCIATALAINVPILELRSLFEELCFNLPHLIKSLDIHSFTTKLGLSNGAFITDFATKILRRMMNKDDITFKELYAYSGKVLKLYAVNITKSRTIEMSVLNTPEMSVKEAMRRSCALPLLFQPIREKDAHGSIDYIVDGGVQRSIPAADFPSDKTMAFHPCFSPALETKEEEDEHGVKDLMNYMNNIMSCTLDQQSKDVIDRESFRYVVTVRPSVSTTSFLLSHSEIHQLFDSGMFALQSTLLNTESIGLLKMMFKGLEELVEEEIRDSVMPVSMVLP